MPNYELLVSYIAFIQMSSINSVSTFCKYSSILRKLSDLMRRVLSQELSRICRNFTVLGMSGADGRVPGL